MLRSVDEEKATGPFFLTKDNIVLRVPFAITAEEVSKVQSGCLDGKVKSKFAQHDLLTNIILLLSGQALHGCVESSRVF